AGCRRDVIGIGWAWFLPFMLIGVASIGCSFDAVLGCQVSSTSRRTLSRDEAGGGPAPSSCRSRMAPINAGSMGLFVSSPARDERTRSFQKSLSCRSSSGECWSNIAAPFTTEVDSEQIPQPGHGPELRGPNCARTAVEHLRDLGVRQPG